MQVVGQTLGAARHVGKGEIVGDDAAPTIGPELDRGSHAGIIALGPTATATATATPTPAPTAIPTPEPTLAPAERERAVLVALYEATAGSDWTDSTGWLSDAPVGEWHGVTVDDDGLVTQLSLLENGLTGQIPASLGELYNLRHLDLGQNQLSDELPSTVGNLSGLVRLDLAQNQLSGEVPAELGKLESLNLGNNDLTGTVPPELAELTNLGALLLLRNNQFTGDIPQELQGLATVHDLVGFSM